MSVFVIADLHLSLGADKPMDVFRGWEGYVQRLEENWDTLVKPEDTVVIAGDVSWAMKLSDTYEDFEFLHRLPGRKLILKGNHDYWWSTRSKIESYFAEKGFYDLGVIHNCAVVTEGLGLCGTRGWMYHADSQEDKKIIAREAGRLKASIEDALKQGAEPVAFLHYPPVYDEFVCREILDVLREYSVSDCYFGHIHGSSAAKKALTGEYEGIAMHLVSCDYLGFAPKLIPPKNIS